MRAQRFLACAACALSALLVARGIPADLPADLPEEPADPAEPAEGAIELRRHDVRWLVAADADLGSEGAEVDGGALPRGPGIPICLQGLGELYPESVRPSPGMRFWPLETEPGAEGLAGLVEGTVDPETWSSAVTILARGGDLLVRANPASQARVAGLLRRLEAALEPRIVVDLALVPSEALAAALEAGPDAGADHGAASWLAPDAIDRAARAAGTRGVLLSARAAEGAWKRLRPPASTTIVADHEVNQSFVEPVKGPAFAALPKGPFAEVRAWLLPGEPRVRVDVRLGRTEPLGLETRTLAAGAIDLPRWREEHAAATRIVPVGATALIAICRAPAASPRPRAVSGDDPRAEAVGPASFAALVRVRVELRDEPSGLPGPALLPFGGLVEELPDHRLPESRPWPEIRFDGQDDDEDDDPPPGPATGSVLPAEDRRPRLPCLVEADRLMPALEAALGDAGQPREIFPRKWRGTWLVVEAPAAAVRRAREVLAEASGRLSTQVAVDVWALRLAVADAVRMSSGGDGLESARLEELAARDGGASARLLLTDGSTASVATVAAGRYIGDVNKTCGGSERRVLFEHDPEVETAGAGLAVNATARVLPGGRRIHVRLRGDLSSGALAWRRREVVANEHRPHGGPEERLGIDLPETVSCLFAQDTELPSGTPVLLDVVPDAVSPGWCRALVARAAVVPRT